jgi:hypothetical protein
MCECCSAPYLLHDPSSTDHRFCDECKSLFGIWRFREMSKPKQMVIPSPLALQTDTSSAPATPKRKRVPKSALSTPSVGKKGKKTPVKGKESPQPLPKKPKVPMCQSCLKPQEQLLVVGDMSVCATCAPLYRRGRVILPQGLSIEDVDVSSDIDRELSISSGPTCVPSTKSRVLLHKAPEAPHLELPPSYLMTAPEGMSNACLCICFTAYHHPNLSPPICSLDPSVGAYCHQCLRVLLQVRYEHSMRRRQLHLQPPSLS